MTLIIIGVYLALTFVLTVMGIEKHVSGFHVFVVSLFLTPVAALLYIYSKKSNSSQISYFHCSECDYIYPVKMDNCPICAEMGLNVKLKKYKSPYTASDVVGIYSVA
jgi:hypothetical protein